MDLNNEQYEQIARKLDGSEVSLTAREQAAVEDIVRDENWLAGKLDVPLPQQAMARARNRLAAAIAKSPRKLIFAGYVAAVVSAAALILLTFSFIMTSSGPVGDGEIVSLPDDLLFAPIENNYAIAIISAQMDEFEADLALSDLPGEIEMQVDELMEETEEFWLYDLPYEFEFSDDNPA